MQYLKMNSEGLKRFTDIIMSKGPADETHTHFDVDCYRQEAENIASHAFHEGLPAVLTVFDPAYENGDEIELPRHWFEGVNNGG